MDKTKNTMSCKNALKSFAIYIVFVIIVIVLTLLTKGRFLKWNNILNVLRQVSVKGIIAMGMTLILITGGIDLSVGSVLALAGVIATDLAHPDPFHSLLLIILVALLVGAACGLINGCIIAFVKAPAFIVTMGMMTAARGATMIYSAGHPIVGLSDQFLFIGQGYLFGIPTPVYFFIVVTVISLIILNKTKLGRYIYAIGGSEDAANASGIDIVKIKIFVYTYCTLLCGRAGLILASRTSSGQPSAGCGYELDAIAGAVVGGTSTAGGKGGIYGTIIGVILLGILTNGLDLLNVSSYIQQIVKGVIIVGAVCLDAVASKKQA